MLIGSEFMRRQASAGVEEAQNLTTDEVIIDMVHEVVPDPQG